MCKFLEIIQSLENIFIKSKNIFINFSLIFNCFFSQFWALKTSALIFLYKIIQQ